MQDFISIFQIKLNQYGIKGKQLAEAAGRSPQNISEILNRKSSPTLESFALLLDACDRLRPGFKADYLRSLQGEKIDLNQFVSSLSSAELSTLLVCVSQRIQSYQPMAGGFAAAMQAAS